MQELKEISINLAKVSPNDPEILAEEDLIQWYFIQCYTLLNAYVAFMNREHIYNVLFNILHPHLLLLFPSSRMSVSSDDALSSTIDLLDQPAWRLLAGLAVHAIHERQQLLVATLREKILDNIVKAREAKTENERDIKLANVDLFLNAIGLDSNQINL